MLNRSDDFWDVLYGGIRPDIPGHGGQECAAYLSKNTMIFETVLSTSMMVVVGVFGYCTYTMPQMFVSEKCSTLKKILLVFLSLVFGVEIGFKICSRQVLYLLNPCHVITAIEIYLLASGPSRFTIAILRTLVHYVYGALIAIVFPDTLCRLFPGEVLVYWIQHLLIFFVVPPFLIYAWGPRSLEPFSEWAWCCFAGILFGIHNHYILQPVAIATQVNLNYVLCPAVVDPFRGPYYRTIAVFHQAFCLLTLGKVYTSVTTFLLRQLTNWGISTKVE